MNYPIPFILNTPFYHRHAQLLCSSFERWTEKKLLPIQSSNEELIKQLFYAPFALVSHGTEADPIFNFGNQTSLNLFEMEWEDFTQLPSRKSAEPVNREERARFMARVTREGFIDDYSGIRIAATGKRFMIEKATVWNIVDEKEQYCGQAAVFDQWMYL